MSAAPALQTEKNDDISSVQLLETANAAARGAAVKHLKPSARYQVTKRFVDYDGADHIAEID